MTKGGDEDGSEWQSCSNNTKIIYRTYISPVHKLICDRTKRESYKMYETKIRRLLFTLISSDRGRISLCQQARWLKIVDILFV